MRIGFHIPFSGSIKKLKERVAASRGNTFQLFARGLRGGKLPNLTTQKANELAAFVEEKNIRPIIVHAPYVYNLAQDETEDLALILEDLVYAEKLGAAYYVLQPGYAKKVHPAWAVENVKRHLVDILEQTAFSGQILIKNMSGAGSEIAHTLDVYNELITFHPKVEGTLDLARAFSAGHSFTTEEEAKRFLDEFEEEVGWEKIKMLYINDNDRPAGSKKNHFAPIGEGMIGFQGYRPLLQNSVIKDKIWIIEHQPTLQHIDRTVAYLMPFFSSE